MTYDCVTTTDGSGGKESPPFKCRQCRGWFVTFRWNVSCCVDHGGGCCHYNDRAVPKPVDTVKLSDIDFEGFR